MTSVSRKAQTTPTQNLNCLYTHSIDAEEDSDPNLDFYPAEYIEDLTWVLMFYWINKQAGEKR